MKHHLLFLFFLLVIGKLSAQRSIVDSMKSLIEKSQADTIRVRHLQELAETYRVSPDMKNIDSALYYGDKSLALAKELNDKRGEVRALIVLGESSRYETDPIKAIEYFQQALRLSESIKDTLGLIMGLNGYALLYYYKSDFRQELSYYLKVVNLARKINNRNELRFALGRIGKTYFILGQTDSAEYYLQQAIAMKLDEEDPFSISHLGRLRLYQQDYKNAFQYFGRALTIYSKKNDKFRIAQCYYDIARLYEEQNKLDSALYNYKLSYEQGSQIADSLYTIEGVGTDLAVLYEKMNNLPEALRYYKIAASAKDRLKNEENLTRLLNLEFQERERKREIETTKIEYLNKVKLFIVLGALVIISIISFFLYRNNVNKRKTNVLLTEQKGEIENAFRELKQTQAQLIQSEKMASLGELTAGIAHEIQNPLNFVNNFSEVNTELIEEMKTELKTGNKDDAIAIANNIAENEEKINFHGKRADAIVKGMLQHSRSSTGQKEPTDINALADEYLRLAYHGLRAKDKAFNAKFETDFDNNIGKINIIPQDIGRVILNLITNAFYAVSEKKKLQPEYEPIVIVATKALKPPSGGLGVLVSVKDNGNGIPQKVVDKIFQPFFTTKPTGQGTGLGLSISYDIITKGHGGDLRVETEEGKGSEFIITIPNK